MKRVGLLLFTYLAVLTIGYAQQPYAIVWRATQQDTTRQKFDLIIKNNQDRILDLSKYDIWFNSNYHVDEQNQPDYTISDQNGNLYRIHFTKPIRLAHRDSVVITYKTSHPITHISFAPNGFYLQSHANPQDVVALPDPQIIAPAFSTQSNISILADLYQKNASFHTQRTQLILPTPSSITTSAGHYTLHQGFSYYIDPALADALHGAFQQLADDVASLRAKSSSQANSAQLSIQKTAGLADDAYRLSVDANGIRIQASHPQGAFYGIQSFISLLPADYQTTKSINIPHIQVEDAPRYSYRGLMLDISRNFKDLNTLKRYIDVMSRYKLNKLHLHLIDDEGWRLEIPSLPELTAIGANRTTQFADGSGIQPSYGSGAKQKDKQYLSKEEFKELLRYANDRFVTVIPEIETPGHARASVKAMEARYHRLLKQGQQEEAERFLMHDFHDKSIYYSAQYWQDNVMNPALPGTYRFIAHILDEIKAMYQEAGLSLKVISIGGDELPTGSWEGSPLVQALMKEQGYTSVHEVWTYYIDRVHAILKEKNLTMAGWEEIGMVNRGKGMEVNEDFADRGFWLDVWNNTIGGGQEDLAYKLANAGHNTVFTSASNFYFDMAWDNRFEEPGLTWASKTDLYHAYSLLPEQYFANIQYTDRGKKLEKSYFDKKIRLTPKGKKHLIGLKGALWSETVLNNEAMDYMIFPRFFALAERAWAPATEWEDEANFNKKEFDEAYAGFIDKIGKTELPKLRTFAGGFGYRLPAVGLQEKSGKLFANAEYPGFPIHYSKAGEENTAAKAFPSEGLSLKSGEEINVFTIDKNNRQGRISHYRQR